MTAGLNTGSNYAYAAVRIVAGFLFSCHGVQKLFGLLDGNQVEVFTLLGLAGIIELVGGVLIALGVLVPITALVASGQMAAAYFMAHAGQGLWPILNGGELAALYCFLFLYIATRGAGPLSLGRMGS